MKLNNDFYRELASRTGNIYTKFDYFMVEEIKNLTPFDLFFPQQTNQKMLNNMNDEYSYYLRPELILHYSNNRESNEARTTSIFNELKKTQSFKSPKNSNTQN